MISRAFSALQPIAGIYRVLLTSVFFLVLVLSFTYTASSDWRTTLAGLPSPIKHSIVEQWTGQDDDVGATEPVPGQPFQKVPVAVPAPHQPGDVPEVLAETGPSPDANHEMVDFWARFIEVLTHRKPNFNEVRRKPENAPWIFFNKDENRSRPDCVELADDEFQDLKTVRSQVIDDIRALAPSMPYRRGTRGIVTTAPNNAFSILTTSLWLLRRTGSTLPVEIWIKDQEEGAGIPCDVIFPSLNAHCKYMSDYWPKDLDPPLMLFKFTFKPFSLIFSSFEEILFLDDDVLSVMRPDKILESEPFTSTGMVFWPDYWADTASTYMYQLSDMQVPPLNETATTESGVMLVNKRTHAEGLLLSAWYIYWGMSYWFPLVSQGAPGEGDKDLWRFAMESFNLTWYQVEELPRRVGYYCDDNMMPIGSLHSHPLDDWHISEYRKALIGSDTIFNESAVNGRPIFIHANLPKLDPYLLIDWADAGGWADVMRCDNGTGRAHRLYGPTNMTIPLHGWDFEKSVWDSFMWSTCIHGGDYRTWTESTIWRPNPRKGLCETITTFWNEFFPGESWSRRVPDPAEHLQEPGWQHVT